MLEIKFTKKSEKHLKQIKKDPIKLKKFKALILSIIENIETPLNGLGRPEALKEDLQGFYSRRLNDKDRLVYIITEKDLINEENILENSKILTVISILGHYED